MRKKLAKLDDLPEGTPSDFHSSATAFGWTLLWLITGAKSLPTKTSAATNR